MIQQRSSLLPAITVLCGTAFAAMVFYAGDHFFYNAFYNPDTPYLPDSEQSVQVIIFWTSIMMVAVQSVFAMVMLVLTSWYQGRATRAGQDAALATPGQPKEPTIGT